MITMLLADDHTIVRAGVRHLIGAEADMRLVGEVADGTELLTALNANRPDVLILDISMPGMPFLELLGQVRAMSPQTRVLVLSMHPEEQYGIRALRGGAAGYLTKDRASEELVNAIRVVHSGKRYVSPSLAQHLAAVLQEGETSPHEELSAREFEVLGLLIAGRTVKQIAASMSLSMKTVSTYRTRIMQKLRVQTTADLVRYALKHHLLDLQN
jgi:two-component system invasion response regulator UvrY